MPAHLFLLETPRSHETIRALEELLEAARNGKVRGIAYAAFTGPRSYIADAVGAAAKDPTYARGALLMLGQKLGQTVIHDLPPSPVTSPPKP